MRTVPRICSTAVSVAFSASMLPAATGLLAHEWLGLALVVLAIAHVVLGWETGMRIARAAVKPHSGGAHMLLVLDFATLVTIVVCACSGLAVSGTVRPALGMVQTNGFFFWDPLHAASAKVLFILVVVHIAVRLRCVAIRFSRKRFTRRKESSHD